LILGPFEKMKVSYNSLTHQKSYCRTPRKKHDDFGGYIGMDVVNFIEPNFI